MIISIRRTSTIQKAKSYIKVRFPRLLKLYRRLLRVSEELKGSLEFRHCMTQNRPYFGSIMAAKQGNPRRHWYMQCIVEQECLQSERSAFTILEIGSWAGGSAITWAEAIKKFNHGNGLVVCMDPWVQYLQANLERGGVYDAMSRAIGQGKILNLFMHNIKASGHEDVVRFIRGSSDEFLSRLAKNQFDLVFIDGAHTYDQVLKDLINSAPLLRDEGILCGDDLELQAPMVDMEFQRRNLEFDFICDPKTNKWYHPGVTLAVAEYFGAGGVSVWEGFWTMRKREIGQKQISWEKVIVEKCDRKAENPETPDIATGPRNGYDYQ